MTTTPRNTLIEPETPIIPAGDSPSWIAFGLVSASYFVIVLGVIAYCVVLP